MPSDNEPPSLVTDVAASPPRTDEADADTDAALGQGDSAATEHDEEAATATATAVAVAASEVTAKGEDEPQSQLAPSPADSRSEEGEARSDDDSPEDGKQQQQQQQQQQRARDGADNTNHTATDEAPPLPAEAPPPGQDTEADDGWSAQWDATNQTWYFYNRFTGISQWDNPRQPPSTTTDTTAAVASAPPPPPSSSIAGGYNPAIHGSWDPNAPYAQAYQTPDVSGATASAAADDDEAEYQADLAMYDAEMQGADPTTGAAGFEYAQPAAFNKRTGKPALLAAAGGAAAEGDLHSDASRSYRQMNAYFNVDQAANSHDGRSLKAERRGKQPTRKELSMWKEKRKARKEEKRRAWLRD